MVSSIIVIGGYNGTAYLSSTEGFNSVTQAWASLPSMTTIRGFACACIVNKTKVIVCGGFNNGPLYSCETLELSNIIVGWKVIANMSAPRSGASGNLLPDNKRFLLIGGNGSTCETLNIASNTWSTAARLLSVIRNAHSSVLFKNNVIVMGGYDGANVLKTCEQYDDVTNTWSAFPSFSTARRLFASAVVLGKIYIAGGSGASSGTQALSSVEVFNGTSWSSLPSSLSQARSSCEAVLYQNKLVVIGGLQALIEVYDPITSTWNTTFIRDMKIYPLRSRFTAVSF
jgi:N-acetylneuraminic acid mutarotase